jgi:pyrroloquinoline quinone biosynthesis protein D
MTPASIPCFAPGMKLRHDAARDRWTVMGPERMFLPDETALEILRLVDGQRSVDAIIDDLARAFFKRHLA